MNNYGEQLGDPAGRPPAFEVRGGLPVLPAVSGRSEQHRPRRWIMWVLVTMGVALAGVGIAVVAFFVWMLWAVNEINRNLG